MFKKLTSVLTALAVTLPLALLPVSVSAATSISITSPSNGASSIGSSFTVTGTATDHRYITVKVNGTIVGITTSDSSGNWSVNVTGQATGTKTIEATASLEALYTNILNPNSIGDSYMSKINALSDTEYGTFSTISGGLPFTNWSPNSTFTQAYGTAVELSSPNVFNIDLVNETVTNFTMAGTSPRPSGIAFNGDDSKVYIPDSNNDTLRVYNTANDSEIGSGIALGDSPIYIAKRPGSDEVWVNNTAGQTLSVVNTQTDSVVATYPLNNTCGDLKFSPDGSKVYVAFDNGSGGGIYVINSSNGSLATTINSGGNGAGQLTINHTGSRLYSTNITTTDVDVYNLDTNSFITSIDSGGSATALASAITLDDSKLYVTKPNLIGGANGTTIAVINATNNTVSSSISVIGAPFYPRIGIAETATTSISYTLNSDSSTDGLADTGDNTKALSYLALSLVIFGLAAAMTASRRHTI